MAMRLINQHLSFNYEDLTIYTLSQAYQNLIKTQRCLIFRRRQMCQKQEKLKIIQIFIKQYYGDSVLYNSFESSQEQSYLLIQVFFITVIWISNDFGKLSAFLIIFKGSACLYTLS
ncbi:unnamed protein product [Paramecium octaurelia]|uniref:Uncharacterized protein n=1 Tax=Paramecium octaurelia TaxID=43137 RepID=A0A8S1XGX7_PAROT|nr:unnamed protein product [Paramecium octaurelia]